jgi:hypothetical protein
MLILYKADSVPCPYCTMLILCNVYTAQCWYLQCRYCTMLILCNADTVQCWYCAMPILYNVDNVQCWYCTMLILYTADTVQCWYFTMPIFLRFAYLHWKWSGTGHSLNRTATGWKTEVRFRTGTDTSTPPICFVSWGRVNQNWECADFQRCWCILSWKLCPPFGAASSPCTWKQSPLCQAWILRAPEVPSAICKAVLLRYFSHFSQILLIF